MTEEPKPESPKDDAEFQRVLENLVNTPHKPHAADAKDALRTKKIDPPAD